MKIIIFLTQNIFSHLLLDESAGNDTLPLSIHNTGVFIDNGHHQLRIRDLLFLHVASSRINEAKYFIISHIPCRFACIKKHSSFSFTALLVLPFLSKHKRTGEIGILKAGVHVSGVARY